jgi:1-acyl-sn-glycerol-3-phosphate acyltransferase
MLIKKDHQSKIDGNLARKNIKGGILYRFMRKMVRLYSILMFNLDVEKGDLLPAGPKIFVANHPSFIDPFLLHIHAPMSIIITGEAFAIPGVGSLLRGIGQISAATGSGTIEKALNMLAKGRSIGIFPEGGCSPRGGGFCDPRSGAARIALASGLPVIPVGIHLRRDKFFRSISMISGLPIFSYLYFWGPYAITIGKPMVFTGDVEDRELVKSVSNTIMDQVKSLAGESETRLVKKKRPTRSKVLNIGK